MPELATVEVSIEDRLGGTVWGSWAGQLTLRANSQFARDHGFPKSGRWEVQAPNIVILIAAPADLARVRREKFELVDDQLRSCQKHGGIIYSRVVDPYQ